MKRSGCLLFACALSVAACGVPIPDAEALRGMSDLHLCQQYALGRSLNAGEFQLAIRTELDRRGAVSPAQWDDIVGQRIRTNMPEHVAVCSWGPYQSINTTAGSFGRHNQIVFGDFGPYVYTENGRVRSWQARLR